MLICVDDDPYDMRDLSRAQGAPRLIVQRMMGLLPPEYVVGCNQSFHSRMSK